MREGVRGVTKWYVDLEPKSHILEVGLDRRL